MSGPMQALESLQSTGAISQGVLRGNGPSWGGWRIFCHLRRLHGGSSRICEGPQPGVGGWAQTPADDRGSPEERCCHRRTVERGCDGDAEQSRKDTFREGANLIITGGKALCFDTAFCVAVGRTLLSKIIDVHLQKLGYKVPDICNLLSICATLRPSLVWNREIVAWLYIEPSQGSEISNGGGYFISFDRWSALLLPLQNGFIHVTFGWFIRLRPGQFFSCE